MLAELKPYPENQPAHPWLGAVPASWTLTTLGAITTRRSARNRTDLPLLSVLREKGVVPRSSLGEDENHNFIPDDLSNYRVAFAGDLVVNKMKAWQGSVGIAPCDGIVSPAYFVFKLFGITQPFAHRLFRSKPYVAFFGQSSDGVRIGQWDLSIDRMKRIPVPLPPPAEQAGIVRFLGAVDRKVNRFIRAKRRLIEVLTEQKQAIITHAVTKGLNPSAPLKPSGIDWLGDVPEHWEMWQIGHFAAVGNGSTPSRGNMSYWTGGTFPWLNSSTVNARTISASDQFVTDTALRECHLPRVPAGSVLVAITGQGKTRGMAAVLTIEATINQHLAFIRPRATGMTATPEYLRLFLHAAYPELRRMSDDSGSTKGALTCEDLRHFRVALMPRAEQHAVVAAVAEQTRDVDAVIDRTEREIDLIRDYRTRLVADVVTGKVDVRGVAIPDDPHTGDAGDDAGADAQGLDGPGGDGDEGDPDDADAALAAGSEEAEA